MYVQNINMTGNSPLSHGFNFRDGRDAAFAFVLVPPVTDFRCEFGKFK